MTGLPSFVALPVATKPEQCDPLGPSGGLFEYSAATCGHQYPVSSIQSFQPMTSSRLVSKPPAVKPSAMPCISSMYSGGILSLCSLTA